MTSRTRRHAICSTPFSPTPNLTTPPSPHSARADPVHPPPLAHPLPQSVQLLPPTAFPGLSGTPPNTQHQTFSVRTFRHAFSNQLAAQLFPRLCVDSPSSPRKTPPALSPTPSQPRQRTRLRGANGPASSSKQVVVTEEERIKERNRKGRERSLRTRRRNAIRLQILEQNIVYLTSENHLLKSIVNLIAPLQQQLDTCGDFQDRGFRRDRDGENRIGRPRRLQSSCSASSASSCSHASTTDSAVDWASHPLVLAFAALMLCTASRPPPHEPAARTPRGGRAGPLLEIGHEVVDDDLGIPAHVVDISNQSVGAIKIKPQNNQAQGLTVGRCFIEEGVDGPRIAQQDIYESVEKLASSTWPDFKACFDDLQLPQKLSVEQLDAILRTLCKGDNNTES